MGLVKVGAIGIPFSTGLRRRRKRACCQCRDGHIASVIAHPWPLGRAHDRSVRLAILTEFQATLFYLHAQLKEFGLLIHTMHGGMSADEMAHSIEKFRVEGGILLATMAATRGQEFPSVQSLVLYDLPGNPDVVPLVYARFQPLAGTEPLTVSILYNLDMADAAFAKILDKLRHFVADDGTRFS